MQKHPQQLYTFHQELTELEDQIDRNSNLKSLILSSKKVSTQLEEHQDWLPTETSKKQQKLHTLHQQLVDLQEEKDEDNPLYGIVFLGGFILQFLIMYLTENLFSWPVLSITIALTLVMGFAYWKIKSKKKKKLKKKLSAIKRDLRYLGHLAEYKYLSSKEK